MLEKIHFIGGLNSDDDDRLLPDGDYRYALNIRNSKGDKDSVGAIENSKGNTEITFTLPNGLNKCIGNKYDEKNRRFIFFIWNSSSFHSIYEFNQGSATVTLLMQSSVFNFDRNSPILHCNIIDDLCYWTDEYNPPRKINIEVARNGGYTTINEQAITRIQYAPNYSPTNEYYSDSGINFNRVRNKVFQFRYRYIYDDNEISASSPISKIAIPPSQSLYDTGGYYPTNIDNAISVTVNTGYYRCKRIQILVREGNIADWYIAKELDKNELSISDDTTYTYNFLNDEVFIPVTQAEVNRLFDNVPLISGCQSMVDGNRLVDSDVTDGYDNLVVEATAVPIYNELPPDITSRVSASPDNSFYSPYSTNVVADEQIPINYSGSSSQYIRIDSNTVNDTDIWKIGVMVEVLNQGVPGSPTMVQVAKDFIGSFPALSTSQDIAEYFRDAINNDPSIGGINSGVYPVTIPIIGQSPYANLYLSSSATVVNIGGGIYSLNIHYVFNVTFDANTPYPLTYIRLRTFAEINSGVNLKTFKHNSKNSFALVYYDEPNRSGLCQVTSSFDVDILPYSNLIKKGNVGMEISILSAPPSWAKYYQLLYTGNRSVSSYLQVKTGSFTTTGTTIKLYINSIVDFNTANGGKSSLSYSWAKGDRITFIRDNVTTLYYNGFYDVEILSSSSDGSGQYIIISNNLPFSLSNNTISEIYTPRLSQNNVVYWEIGEVYSIVNGLHTGNTQNQTSSLPAVITTYSGDSYFRYRGYNIDYYIEDYSLSDFYVSNSWDKGRFNVVDKDYKQLRRYATSYYSEQYVPDTNINGLSTVYDTSFHEANKNYGAIQKTYSEQDRLLFCQETRTGFSLVNKSVLYNSNGTPNGVVGQQSEIISEVQYYAQPYGIGNYPESFAVNGTRKYFVDPTEGYVLRLSIDGFTEINKYKYFNYFQKKFQSRKDIPTDSLGKIWGVFDVRFDEYVLLFESCQGPSKLEFTKSGPKIVFGALYSLPDTVSFSETKNRWVTHYKWYPEMVGSNGIDVMSWDNGGMFLHNSNDTYNNFYGVQYNSQIEVVANENPSSIKFFTSLFEEGSDVWSVQITTPEGQASSLDTTDFELNENVYYAGLLKDSNTPNVTLPLIEGDDIRSYAMGVKLTNNNTSFVKLFAINVRYGLSELTNK